MHTLCLLYFKSVIIYDFVSNHKPNNAIYTPQLIGNIPCTGVCLQGRRQTEVIYRYIRC